MKKEKQEFFKRIHEDFFEERTIDMNGLKDFVKRAFIGFGTVEVKDEIDEDGDRVLTFIDNDSADVVCAPEGTDLSKVDTDMSTTLCKICIDEDNTISMIQHGFGLFTPANKENVLMASFLIGKKVEENE